VFPPLEPVPEQRAGLGEAVGDDPLGGDRRLEARFLGQIRARVAGDRRRIAQDRVAVLGVRDLTLAERLDRVLVPDHREIGVAAAEQEVVAQVVAPPRLRFAVQDEILVGHGDRVDHIDQGGAAVVLGFGGKDERHGDGVGAAGHLAFEPAGDLAERLVLEGADLLRQVHDQRDRLAGRRCDGGT
jgi:hypothetical protein